MTIMTWCRPSLAGLTWCDGRPVKLDAQGASDGDEVVTRFRNSLIQLLPSCEDRLLALRVEIRGATQAHAVAEPPTRCTGPVSFVTSRWTPVPVASGSKRFCSGRRHSVV